MSVPGADEVRRAVAAWAWVPEYARTVEADGFLAVRYPDHFDVPLAVVRLEVPDGAAAERVLAAALDAARGLDHPWCSVQVPLGAPPEVETALVRRGARVAETLDVLARPVVPAVPVDLAVPGDLEVRPETETDLSVARDERRVAAEVFGGSPPSGGFLASEVAGADARRATGQAWRGVAYLDGRAVGSGGATLVDGVLRLWGGAVLAEARGRGAYRALLAERLAWGAGHGARTALVRGRVTTSGPILRRAGFAAYGTIRDWKVEL